MAKKESAEKAVRDIRRRTRRRFSAEEKIRIVIEGLRGEEGIASLCRREGIAANLYYRWSKSSWRRARSACWAIRSEKPAPARSWGFVRKTPGSRSWWPRRSSRTVCSKKA